MTTVALAGNPNSGKSTLFNVLTGARQRVGNWSGVTVERRSGFFTLGQQKIEVVDLPGTYSLTFNDQHASLDEKIACDFLQSGEVDVVVNVVDAANLERHLYLTVQLLEMKIPVIVALNMMDIARKKGISIDVDRLAKELGCPVVALEASRKKGVTALCSAICHPESAPCHPESAPCHPERSEGSPDAPEEILRYAQDDNGKDAQGDMDAETVIADAPSATAVVPRLVRGIQGTPDTDLDDELLQADARYRLIEKIISHAVKQVSPDRTWSKRIDDIVLNRFLGIPIFLLMMYGLFFFAINIGGAFQDFFDIASDTIFVGGFSQLLLNLHVPAWLTALLANGLGKGINTTITFIPVIGAMFLFLSLLEDSGYMARAAFVVDRLMRAMGLPGKSFVPMIVGFGCNVPAVMAARTLENRRDRILTVMMSPFVSCGARLAIYTVFVSAFFPVGGNNVIFLLYLIGIVLAVITGFLLRKTLLAGEPAPLIMELPMYHVPRVRSVLLHTWQKLRGFVFRAGKLIIPICMLLGALNAINVDGSLNRGKGGTHSLLSATGRVVTPIFAPMGVESDNWPATVGLVTGVLAKEVVIGTLNTLYSQAGHLPTAEEGFNFTSGLQEAVQSIPANFAALGSSLSNPVLAKAPVHTLSQSVYGEMYQRFHGQLAAFAYLLFVLLYFPCVSTVAVMGREIGQRWAWFSVVWSTGVAYAVSVAFYQLATVVIHPVSSLLWVCAMVAAMGSAIFIVRRQHAFV